MPTPGKEQAQDNATRPDDLPEEYDENAEGEQTMKDDEPAETPHGHGAIHDMHDFYSAGQDVADKHLQLADNPELKDMLQDHGAQLEAMSQEMRDLCQKSYPEHPQPEPREGGMEEETETPSEGGETADEAEQDFDDEPTEKSEDEEDEPEKKSRTRKAAKPAGRSGFSEKSAIERTIERKKDRLMELMLDEILAD